MTSTRDYPKHALTQNADVIIGRAAGNGIVDGIDDRIEELRVDLFGQSVSSGRCLTAAQRHLVKMMGKIEKDSDDGEKRDETNVRHTVQY